MVVFKFAKEKYCFLPFEQITILFPLFKKNDIKKLYFSRIFDPHHFTFVQRDNIENCPRRLSESFYSQLL